MNFDQFLKDFRRTATKVDDTAKKQDEDVVLAGTVLEATKDSFHIAINGAEYKIAPSDVIDIQVISAAEPSKDTAKDTKSKPDDGKEAEAVATARCPPTVLIKVSKNAVVLNPVPAAVLAAMGTWMSVSFAEEAA